jgi:hypothetical protein
MKQENGEPAWKLVACWILFAIVLTAWILMVFVYNEQASEFLNKIRQ